MKTSGDSVYVMDTYAWVEYFIGSDKGETVKKLIEGEDNTIITPECVLAELKGWALRQEIDFEELYKIVRKLSDVHCLITIDWLNAASIRNEMRRTMKDFGMIDALIVAQQERFGCKVVSGDPHFKDRENTVFLG